MITAWCRRLILAVVCAFCLADARPVQAQLRYVRYVTNVADLVSASLNPSGNDYNLQILGFYTANDGGGGSLTWTPGSATTIDMGTAYPSGYPGASGRYIRRVIGPLQLAWFGAQAAAQSDFTTGIASNNAALLHALNYLSSHGGGELDIGLGYYNITSPIVLPQVGASSALVGVRQDGSILRYLGTGTAVKGGGATPGAGAYLFRNLTISGEGNVNPVHGLVITNDANRDLRFENFAVHDFHVAGSVGLTLDAIHSVEGNLKLDFNDIAFELGALNFLHASELYIISENARTNGYSGLVANSIGLHLRGTYETSGPILVTNCTDFQWDGYAENNFPGTFDLIHNKSAVIAGFIDGDGVDDYGIRLGDNTFASLGHGYDISTKFQFLGAAIVIGSGGLGPRTPDIANYSSFAVMTNILFESNLDSGPMTVRLSGIDYRYDTDGHILSAVGGPIAGSHAAQADFSGATNFVLILPRSSNGNEPTGGPGGALTWIFDNGRTKVYDGTNWNIIGYGDGSVTTVSGATGIVNTVVKWTGNGFQLSTNSIIRENGFSVIIGDGTNAPLPTTKLWVLDGGTNSMVGSSSTVVFRNGGISTNANVLELQSNAAGTSFIARNDGNIGLPFVGPLKLLRTDASTNVAEVTAFAGITWDGVTLTATGGGPGATNAITTINGTTNQVQSFAVGGAGADFNIVDGPAGLHTINLPTGSASVRGAISTADWSTFSGKPNINATDEFVPYRVNSAGFGDSLLRQETGLPYAMSMSYRAANNSGPNLILRKQGRTGSATNTPAINSELGVLGFGGFSGLIDIYARSFTAIATENWTPAALGHRLDFYNVPNGSTTAALRLRIDQDGKINIPALAVNRYLGIDGSGNLTVTNAPVTLTTGAGATNIAGVISGNYTAGGNIALTTNANGAVSIAASTSPITGFEFIGSGTDFHYTLGTLTYEQIAFGTSGPSFTLTNAGTYQITLSVMATDASTFVQDFYLTNVTDHVFVQSSGAVYISSLPSKTVFAKQITIAGANRQIQLWGQTSNGTYINSGVSATNTVLCVIRLL